MEAVGNTGAALIHCSAQLRRLAAGAARPQPFQGDDDEIVRTAVSNDGIQLLRPGISGAF